MSKFIPDSRRSGSVCDFYRKYIERLGVIKDRKLNFHFYGYTFVNALREAVAEAGALDAKIGLIVGRSDNSMAGKYKAIKQVYIERTVSIMNAVSHESGGVFDWLLISQQYHTNLKREKPDKESEVGRSENSVAATKPNRMVMTSKFLGLSFGS